MMVSANLRFRKLLKTWQLYVLMLPALAYFIIFKYVPMYGVQIAFKDYFVSKGIWGSPWAGLEHFERFFNSYYVWDIIRNTFAINLYQLALFPISIIVALAINELRNGRFKKTVQTVTYAPHFISAVVLVGMVIAFLNPVTGIINYIIQFLGFTPIEFLTDPGWIKTIYVFTEEWQNLGWGAIIYLAALAGIDPQQHESAKVDGASTFQRIRHINLPGILPTIMILLILNMGKFMTIGFEKLYLLQNPLNLEASDVIQTFVYRSGILEAQYSYSTAVGLFNSLINFALLIAFNKIARKTGNSLW